MRSWRCTFSVPVHPLGVALLLLHQLLLAWIFAGAVATCATPPTATVVAALPLLTSHGQRLSLALQLAVRAANQQANRTVLTLIAVEEGQSPQVG